MQQTNEVMTYSELLHTIIRFTPEQLAQDVTVYDIQDDEFHIAHNLRYTDEDSVLDIDHAFITF